MTHTDVSALLNFDSQLTEEEILIQRTVRDFVARRIKPHIAEWFEQALHGALFEYA